MGTEWRRASDLELAQAHVRYAERRRASYDSTCEVLREIWPAFGLPFQADAVTITHIDSVALAAWYKWPRSPYGDANFPWDRIASYVRKSPRRFEAAIWCNGHLCGLCVGKPSRGPENLTLRLLEGCPGPHPLKGLVALIATLCGERWAILLGKQLLKLKNPNPGAVPIYEQLGFSLAERARGATYYSRRVQSDEPNEPPYRRPAGSC